LRMTSELSICLHDAHVGGGRKVQTEGKRARRPPYWLTAPDSSASIANAAANSALV
jgi:hypothetical protein